MIISDIYNNFRLGTAIYCILLICMKAVTESSEVFLHAKYRLQAIWNHASCFTDKTSIIGKGGEL